MLSLLAPYQNREFIYRGYELEPPQQFQNRIAERFPNAEVMAAKDAVTEAIRTSNSQWIQIQKVLPSSMQQARDAQRVPRHDANLPARVLTYRRHRDVSVFVFVRTTMEVPPGVQAANDAQVRGAISPTSPCLS